MPMPKSRLIALYGRNWTANQARSEIESGRGGETEWQASLLAARAAATPTAQQAAVTWLHMIPKELEPGG